MIKTTFLMALLTVLLVTAGGAFGGEGGMAIAFLLALVIVGATDADLHRAIDRAADRLERSVTRELKRRRET